MPEESRKQKQLFSSRIVPSKKGSEGLFDNEFIQKDSPVQCLGMTFENDEKRREYFLEILKEKLKDPEFRKIEGFPIGKDEDILNLSDPPYYTACPNPWIDEFIKRWEDEKLQKEDDESYHREPFAADVSEGKYDPIYKYHPYPTKVPHKAIMRYILHYTEPGDIVFDGFCGTGMTGVAAQMCGDRNTVQSLGYHVKKDGTILQLETNEEGKEVWKPFSKLGERNAVLSDLSPAATFIAYNYNTPVDISEFEKETKRILREVEEECGWMYETLHEGESKGNINYTVWSDVFVCPECSGEVNFWEAAVDKEAGKVHIEFPCPHCHASLTKRNMDRAWITKYDEALKGTIKQAKQVPVQINYSVSGSRYQKQLNADDLSLLVRIEHVDIASWFPTDKIPLGDKTGEPLRVGITHTHHFYSRRNLHALSLFLSKMTNIKQKLFLTKVAFQITKLYRFTYMAGTWGAGGGPLSGTLYVPSLNKELKILKQLRLALKARCKVAVITNIGGCLSGTESCTSLTTIPDNSLDYIFIDPPFGSNLNYSELAFLWESWLKVRTNNKKEAIENRIQRKGINEYRSLMTLSFRSAYRILKPGRWMTVEFSNTKASVWNSIQVALTEAGFIVANVAALDKQKGSYNAQTNPTSVKQDLVISAYKPNGGFEERFLNEAGTEEGVWDFVRTHLGYLPVVKNKDNELIPIPERDPRILFDQVVAYYVRKGYPVPISSPEFQRGLAERFLLRDGMYFLPDQAAEYDKKRMRAKDVVQLNLFVSDEASAIQWLKQLLNTKPQTFQDINPLFMREIAGWHKHEKALELSELLQQNFLCYEGVGEIPSQIHSYLSSNFKGMRNLNKDDSSLCAKAKDRWYVPDPKKSGDLEQLRERALLREFKDYIEYKKKRLKIFRIEAVRAGFKKAWQERDYSTIIAVAEKIPDKVLQEDPKLLMWYDQAVTRTDS
ncbi:MAG: DNA methylase [Candidatus Aegiribacteria sp.]|nr:DNA methylase [Candidatus Aegiribacteria sp.]